RPTSPSLLRTVTLERCQELAVQPAAELVAIAGEDLGFHRVKDLLHGFSNAEREHPGGFRDGPNIGAHLPARALARTGVVVGHHDRYATGDRFLNGSFDIHSVSKRSSRTTRGQNQFSPSGPAP